MQVLNDDALIDVQIDGTGQTVVMLHGFPLSREIWDAQAAALARDHRIVRPDLRGMGASRVVDGPYLMSSLASDVAAVLDAIGAQGATLVGHSLGGYVALAFARMFAERTRALALVCSRITADTPERVAWRFALAASAESAASSAPIVDAMVPQLLAKTRYESDPALAARVREIALRNDPRGLAAMLRGMALRDGSEDIAPELDMPVLAIAGRADSIPAREVEEMVAAFPHARLVWAEHSGHLPMLEEPQVVVDALRAFLASAG
jgi:3-oxoadipate enol-lactonase